jgi:hypothetical protein
VADRGVKVETRRARAALTEAVRAWNRSPDFDAAAIEARLRQLPLQRAGFEARCNPGDWVFVDLWPIGDDLEPVITRRSVEIAFLILRKHQPRQQAKPSEAKADLARKFRAFARAWRELPEGARPKLDWNVLSFGMRSALAEAHMRSKATTKGDVADLLAVTYYELTGKRPSAHSAYDTPYSVLVRDAFELGRLGDWHAVAGKAAKRFRA